MQKQALSDSTITTTSTTSLWRNRTFAFIFSAHILSVFGNCFQSIAVNLWVLQTTGSAVPYYNYSNGYQYIVWINCWYSSG